MKQDQGNLLKNTNNLIEAFNKISKVFASMESFAGDISLSKPEILALEFINLNKTIGMSQIANGLDISFSMATKIVDSLVKKKLAVRKSDSRDRRIVTMILSGKGEKIVLEYNKQKQIYFGKMLELLSENEQEIFVKVLEKIAGAMQGKINK